MSADADQLLEAMSKLVVERARLRALVRELACALADYAAVYRSPLGGHPAPHTLVARARATVERP